MLKSKRKMSNGTFLLLTTIVLFVLMYGFGMYYFYYSGFAKPQSFLNLFINNAGLIVIGCGMTIVMITGGIDISVGSVTSLVCMVAAFTMEKKGMSVYQALILCLGIGLLYGIVQGYLISYLKIQPFIVTLAGLYFGTGLTAVISTEQIQIKNELFIKWANARIELPFGSYNKRGIFLPAYIYPTVIVAIVVVIVVTIILKYTKFGRSLYAIGGNQQSALMMGLNVKSTKMKAYVFSGFLTGLGGFLFCLNTGAGAVGQAAGLEMEAIAAAVIGGTLLSGGVGTVVGTLFGVLIQGTILNLLSSFGKLEQAGSTEATRAVMLAFFIVLQAILIAPKKKKMKAEEAKAVAEAATAAPTKVE